MSDVRVLGIEITSPDKILYSKQNITKLDVVRYYEDVAKYMMPFLDKRLLSVIRCHHGIEGKSFFKKHPTTEKSHLKTFSLGKDEEDYFYLSKQSDIVYQAQMGTIEFHIWASKITAVEQPDIMTFDLDPDQNLNIDKLCDAVTKLKDVLDSLKLKSFLKTSGGKGYHILVPFSANCNFEAFENFALKVALILEQKWPKLFTTNIRKEERKDKIFVDYLRNGKGATCVCPYSLRAREGAKISMPIRWKDLGVIKPDDVDIFNYKNYIKNDAWKNFFKNNQKIYEK